MLRSGGNYVYRRRRGLLGFDHFGALYSLFKKIELLSKSTKICPKSRKEPEAGAQLSMFNRPCQWHCIAGYITVKSRSVLHFFFPSFTTVMVISTLIDCIKQFFLIGLISLAIVFATIRAYFLAALRAAGLSPLFIFSLLGILTIYGGIAIFRCCGCREVLADEEYGIIDLEVVEGRVLLSRSLTSHRQVNYRILVFFVSHNSNKC